MKNLKRLLLTMTVLCMALLGCTSSDVLPPVVLTKDITQEVPVAVTANANGECLDYTETSTLNLRSNSTIDDYFSVLENIKFNSITWEITNYVGDDGVYINSGSLNFGTTSFEIGEVDLKAADAANQTYYTLDTAKLEAISTAIFSTGSITVTLDASSGGNCDNDFSYTLKLTANVDVTIGREDFE
tara:strand:+ start:1246 stop:1803 length:558 start_codon:yes stop_codon:yes gene_type:complete